MNEQKIMYPGFVNETILNEFKHSVRTHLVIMAGPSQQLSAFLLKVIDFFDDPNEEHRNQEMLALSFTIIEGIALYVQRSIDERIEKAKTVGQEFSSNVQTASNNILIMVGQSRGLDDKIAAKNALLKSVADALRELSSLTKTTYPEIVDSAGKVL